MKLSIRLCLWSDQTNNTHSHPHLIKSTVGMNYEVTNCNITSHCKWWVRCSIKRMDI